VSGTALRLITITATLSFLGSCCSILLGLPFLALLTHRASSCIALVHLLT
jgi:hypothetical protein